MESRGFVWPVVYARVCIVLHVVSCGGMTVAMSMHAVTVG